MKDRIRRVLTFFLMAFLLLVVARFTFRKFLGLPGYHGVLLTQNSGVENLMNEEVFWTIIHSARSRSNRNYESQCATLTHDLEEFSEKEIIQFDRTLTVLMAKSYSFRLWEAAYAMNGGCSDDSFHYFRSWLIAQGKDNFYQTLKYPRLLLIIGVKEIIEDYEGLDYCAMNAFNNRTGKDIPQRMDIEYPDPGPKFNEGQAILRYPELAILAW